MNNNSTQTPFKPDAPTPTKPMIAPGKDQPGKPFSAPSVPQPDTNPRKNDMPVENAPANKA